MKIAVVYHKQLGDTLLLESALHRLYADGANHLVCYARPGYETLIQHLDTPVQAAKGWGGAADQVLIFDPGLRSLLRSRSVIAASHTLLTFSEYYVKPIHRLAFKQIRLLDQQQLYRGHYLFDLIPEEIGSGPYRPPTMKRPTVVSPLQPTRPYIVFHLTSAWRRKCWETDHWCRVLRWIVGHSDLDIALTAGPQPWEADVAESLERDLNHPRIVWKRQTRLTDIFSLVADARLVVSVDGFVAHVAQAYRTPLVVLFGETNPHHWFDNRPGDTCLRAPLPSGGGKPSMADLTAERVIQVLEERLPTIVAQDSEVPPASDRH